VRCIDAGGQTVCASDRLYLAGLVPTLIVWGAADALIPRAARRGRARRDRRQPVRRVRRHGHYPHCEAPARFIETLVDFVDGTEPAGLPEARWQELLVRHAGLTHFEGASA
jgi:pimeloyl-ACP methyl ester carboxylesterase